MCKIHWSIYEFCKVCANDAILLFNIYFVLPGVGLRVVVLVHRRDEHVPAALLGHDEAHQMRTAKTHREAVSQFRNSVSGSSKEVCVLGMILRTLYVQYVPVAPDKL